MDIDRVLESVEQILPSRRLDFVERLVLSNSLLGQTYSEMAQGSSYCDEYLKGVGSQLWQNLSEALGQKVTKKNLHLVLQHYDQNSQKRQRQKQQILLRDTETGNSCSIKPEIGIKFPSASVPLGSPLYINRPPIEELAYAEISRPGCVLRIKAPMKMGKTSLLKRIVAHATTDKQYKNVYIDFQEADVAIFTSLDKFLRWFSTNITKQLHLLTQLEDYWDEDMGSKVSCKIYMQEYILEQIDDPIVLVLDEVHRVFEHPNIAQDFLPMLRFWHEQAQQVKAWQKLRLAIAYSTDIYVPLQLHQSPFNVGLSLSLPQFNLEQVQDLAQRYGLDWHDEVGTQNVVSLQAMVGGHPYLVSLALYHLYQGEMALKELLQTAPTTAGIYSHYLRSHLITLREQPQLAAALQQVMVANDGVQLDAISVHKLESMGLIQLDGDRSKPSCELYRLYFRAQLGAEKWPHARPAQLQLRQLEQQHFSNIEQLAHFAYQSYFEQHLLNNIDGLTHLASRSYFNRYLEATWEQLLVEGASLTIILCEIDQLEVFKYDHGLSARDVCLQSLGRIIFDCVDKQIACTARYEDEKFAAILPRTDAQMAIAIADNIQASIRMVIESNNSEVGVSAPEIVASLGVASTIPSTETSVEMLVAAAEDALSQAKRRGCNCVTITINSTTLE